MLHACHFRLNRSAILSINKHVKNLQPSLGRIPLPHTPCHPSTPRRSLYLSSTAPIRLSNGRKTIIFCLKDGTTITQKFSPTPKANIARLLEALTELLQTPEMPTVMDPPNKSKKNMPSISFGTAEWHLDPEGDAIHRHCAHSWAGECDTVQKLIMRHAEEMHHHPHIARGKLEDGEGTLMTITCTTHSPRGLSSRDTKLAEEINQILAKFNPITPLNPNTWDDLDKSKKEIATQRERMIAMNREKIIEALDHCGCETAKSQSTTSPGGPSEPLAQGRQ